jgi:hypothetical protein
VQDPSERNLAVAEEMAKLIKEGKREDATVLFLTEVVGQSENEIAEMKARVSWAGLVQTIDSQLRQIHALAAYRFDSRRISAVQTPTLLLMGSETHSPYLRQAVNSLQDALPNATLVVLDGQQHNAMDTARDMLAETIKDFLLAEGS